MRIGCKGCFKMLSFWKQSVTRKRPGETTDRGSVIPDWSNATEITINGCSVQPAATTLSQDGRALGISDGYTAFLPPNADVAAGDHIIYNGKEYAIDGEPRQWFSPTGRLDNIQLSLVRWDG